MKITSEASVFMLFYIRTDTARSDFSQNTAKHPFRIKYNVRYRQKEKKPFKGDFDKNHKCKFYTKGHGTYKYKKSHSITFCNRVGKLLFKYKCRSYI